MEGSTAGQAATDALKVCPYTAFSILPIGRLDEETDAGLEKVKLSMLQGHSAPQPPGAALHVPEASAQAKQAPEEAIPQPTDPKKQAPSPAATTFMTQKQFEADQQAACDAGGLMTAEQRQDALACDATLTLGALQQHCEETRKLLLRLLLPN